MDLARVRRLRRPAAGAAVLLAVYALAGFVLVPRLARSRLLVAFEALGLEASIDRLRFNPFTYAGRADGLSVRDGDGELFGVGEALVDFQLSSLVRRAWTFKTIRLTDPRLAVVVREDGSLNLSALVAGSEEPAPAGADAESAIPRVLVHRLEIASGRASLEDRTRPVPFRTDAGPVSLKLTRFSTLPEDRGELAFEAGLESGARFTWRGTVGFHPLHSEGHVRLEDGRMSITKRYLQDLLRFRVTDGRADVETDYAIDVAGDAVRASLAGGSLVVRDLVVLAEDEDVELLRLPELRAGGVGVEWPARTITIPELVLTGARLAMRRGPDGIDALEPFAAAGGADVATGGTAPPDPGFRVVLGRLAVADGAIDWEDRTLEPVLATGVRAIELEVRDVDSAPGSSFPFSLDAGVMTGGSLRAEGRLGVLPAFTIDTALRVEGLGLVPLQSWLGGLARVRLDSGAGSLDGRVVSDADEALRYRGSAELSEVVFHDVGRDERLVGLGRGRADELLLELGRSRLRIAAVDLERPYARLTIHENGTTNIGDVLVAEAPEEPAPPATDAEAFGIEIGELRIHDGSADFADLSLPLPFSSRVESLDGGVSEMVTGGTSARIELEGTVDEYGLARVAGSLDFFAPSRRMDLGVAFRNMEMSRLSPYSAKFAGYEVETGRLSLDLHYRIEDRRLDSDNGILIEQLTLGEKIDSPDAPNLPVKLAVAMLKDRHGRIDLDIPVGGTLDDPEFAYGKLVWKAIRNVLQEVATAPFRALARIAGSDRDLEFVEFAAGASEVPPPAREVLEQLGRALAERPELVLDVRGAFDPEADAAAIRSARLDAVLAERIASLPAPEGGEIALASDRRRDALEALFLERFGPAELDAAVASLGSAPAAPAGAAEPAFDLPAYLDALARRLAAAETVSEDDLRRLADGRAAAIRGVLEAEGVPAERLRTGDSGPIKEKDAAGDWIRLRLVLSVP